MPVSLKKLASDIETCMDKEAKRLSDMTVSGRVARSPGLQAMRLLADRVGVSCACRYSKAVAKPRTRCYCKPKKRKKKRT